MLSRLRFGRRLRTDHGAKISKSSVKYPDRPRCARFTRAMPSPLGHALMGLTIYRAVSGAGSHDWRTAALSVLAANAPDLDFVPGLLTGELGRYHHGPSHSFVFSVLFGILCAVLFTRKVSAFWMGFGLYATHILLDYLVRDPSPPFGVPLFWPFSYEYYMSPVTLYRPFNYPATFAEPIFSTLVSLHNLVTMLLELSFLLPLLVFVSWLKKRGLARSCS